MRDGYTVDNVKYVANKYEIECRSIFFNIKSYDETLSATQGYQLDKPITMIFDYRAKSDDPWMYDAIINPLGSIVPGTARVDDAGATTFETKKYGKIRFSLMPDLMMTHFNYLVDIVKDYIKTDAIELYHNFVESLIEYCEQHEVTE